MNISSYAAPWAINTVTNSTTSRMSLLGFIFIPVGMIVQLVEKLLFLLINLYDEYCYSPLQNGLSPLVARIPRHIDVNGRRFTIFTANIVSWFRTALVIPVVWCLKYDYTIVPFYLILLHDFLDHLDGIVAKVQRQVYGQLDDPLLGGFMDAFCDKIVNCLALWSILLLKDYSSMTNQQIAMYISPCVVIMIYEAVLGIVRVQDYFRAYYNREYGNIKTQTVPNVAAVMEGKLKEKLESMGIACLCLAHSAAVPVNCISGYAGLVCLLLSVRLAHASLQHKLKVRNTTMKTESDKIDVETDRKNANDRTTELLTADTVQQERSNVNSIGIQADIKVNYRRRQSVFDGYDSDIDEVDEEGENVDDERKREEREEDNKLINEKQDLSQKDENREDGRARTLSRSQSVPVWNPSSRMVDRVYTVGCFDLFHEGHVKLLMRLKGLGRKVIVGVHDSRSIFKLKKRVPIDDTCKRMGNVKKYADEVFCVSGTDPTPYLQCIYDQDKSLTSMYIRGDDMKNFPAREFTERIMPVHFLPYTQSVSSTKIRKEVYNASKFGPHVKYDDHLMFY